jgi:NADH:ubiquinone oxidoreductase subunit 6 (subunit J)
MLIAVIVLVFVMTVLALVLFAVVVAGIKTEPPHEELGSKAPSLIAAVTRRLLGVYVSKPTDADDREVCLAGYGTGQSEDGEGR